MRTRIEAVGEGGSSARQDEHIGVEGWGRVNRVNKKDTTGIFRSLHHRDFQVLTPQGLSEKESKEFAEGGFGWINGWRKDHGSGWGKTRGGCEQLF